MHRIKSNEKTKDQLMKELEEMHRPIAGQEQVQIESPQTEKKIERLLHQNELILNAAGEGIFGLDIQGKHTFVNPSAARMLGYEVRELTGQHSHSIWHHPKADGSPYPEEECPIYSAYKDGTIHHVRNEVFWKKDGTSFPVAYTSTPIIEDGNIVGAVVTFRDITERKLAEAELRRSADMLSKALNEHRNIIDAIPDIVYILDINGNLIKWNRRMEIVTKFSSGELTGRHALDFFPEQDKMVINKTIKEVLETGYAECKGHLLRKDGTVVPYEWTGAPFKDEQDNVIGLIGIGRDVSERKKAEESLRETRDYLEKLLNYANAPIIVWDPKSIITSFNHAFERLTGYTNKEVIGKKLNILFPEASKGESLKKIERTLSGEYWESVEIPILCKGESIKIALWNSANIYTEDARTLIATIAQGQDITDRKQAEEALRQSENNYRTLLENLPQKIFLKDRNSVYISCNKNYAQDLGINPHEIVGKTDYDFFPKELADKYRADDKKIMESGKTEDIEEKYIQDGTEGFIQTVKTPVKDNEGKIIAVQGIFWDITERKQAEDKIRKLNEELEQRVLQRTAQLEVTNRELESFSYSVSHDLRAPLRAITGFSSMLLEDYADKLDDEGKRLLNVVKDSILNMNALIDDLLTLSRIGRKEIEHSKIDMDKLAETVFAEIKATVPEREIQFAIKPLPPAYGDQGLLHQVFANLLFNAIKFTRSRENAIVEAGGYIEGPENVYYVKDNGVGFDMQYKDRLFSAFQRLHSGKEFEGTGIGLAIVQRIINRHGGRTWAEGKKDEGATFYFTLPSEEIDRNAPKGIEIL
jgi:PAS domain S-box-containing protein